MTRACHRRDAGGGRSWAPVTQHLYSGRTQAYRTTMPDPASIRPVTGIAKTRLLRGFTVAGWSRQDRQGMSAVIAHGERHHSDPSYIADLPAISVKSTGTECSSLLSDTPCRGAATASRAVMFPSTSRHIARPGRTRNPRADRSPTGLHASPPDDAAITGTTAHGASGLDAQKGRPNHG